MKPVSMGQAVKGDTEGITPADTIADVHDRYEEATNRINREELAGVLWPMVDSLPARLALVIRQQYQAGLSMNEISRLFGISCKELKADRQRALVALSHYRNKARLKENYAAFAKEYAAEVDASYRKKVQNTEPGQPASGRGLVGLEVKAFNQRATTYRRRAEEIINNTK